MECTHRESCTLGQGLEFSALQFTASGLDLDASIAILHALSELMADQDILVSYRIIYGSAEYLTSLAQTKNGQSNMDFITYHTIPYSRGHCVVCPWRSTQGRTHTQILPMANTLSLGLTGREGLWTPLWATKASLIVPSHSGVYGTHPWADLQ